MNALSMKAPVRSAEEQTAVIEFDQVVARFGNLHAMGPTTLSVKKGEFLAIVGPSGCGKSTLLNMVAGTLTPAEGTVHYKGKPVDVRQVARELGVQYVLEGSLQIGGDQVRVTAQLIDGTTGNHVWAERYDRPLEEVFAIQDEVTQTIAASLAGMHGIVARAGRDVARRKPTGNLQAYENYLLGI